jgi:hypothetical protein
MNSFVSKFSTTDADSEIRRAKGIAEEDGLTDAMWGSQAGFGQLVHGHAFDIPAVPDVRSSERFFSTSNRLMACHIPHSSPQRSSGFTPMTMPTPTARSRSNMALPPLLSGFKVALS